jgi:isoleucyl-tRNA synthetase
MSTIIEKRAPFKACFGHGLVLAEDGREMHKSWGNAIWFDDAIETMGADVMRWMYCTNRSETNLLFGYKKAEEIKRRLFIPLWNIYNFFVTYANLDKWNPKSKVDNLSLSNLDKWLFSKLHILVKEVTHNLEKINPFDAAILLEKFVNEMSTWYVRRSRRRFWKSEKDEDKKAAYRTLYECLVTIIKLLAPFIPFITEEIYQNIVSRVYSNYPESIHHNKWPISNKRLINQNLIAEMDLVIKICGLGRSARSQAGIKLRQPISDVRIISNHDVIKKIGKFEDIIKDELNVKELLPSTNREDVLKYIVKPQPRVLGRKYGKLLPTIENLIEKMDQKTLASNFEKGLKLELKINGQRIKLLPEEIEVTTVPIDGYTFSEEENIIVAVNYNITPELQIEGLARDIVRRIQNQRKDAKFNIDDYIQIYYETGPQLKYVIQSCKDYISSETLSTSIRNEKPPEEVQFKNYKIGNEELRIGLLRIEKKRKNSLRVLRKK